MNRKGIFNGISFLLILFINSCNCEYSYEYTVENKTNSRLKILINSQCTDYQDSIIYISNDSKELICYDWHDTHNCDGPSAKYFTVNSIEIYYNDTIISKKDYTNYTNWAYSDTDRTGYFSLSLTNEDFNY